MILAIDMGNTNIVIGGIDSAQTYFVERITTDHVKTGLEYAVNIKNILEIHDINKLFGFRPRLVGSGMKTGLNIIMDNPKTVGSDMIVDAVAVVKEYPLPAIVIDMGTATTMSVVDQKGNYIGGVIFPGLRVSLDSLSSKAAQLPSISLEIPKKVIGKNTIDCMRSGIMYGSAGMIDGIIDRMEAELGKTPSVIATGGLSRFVVPLCRHKIIYDEALLMKGLWILYEKNH